ncbi:MAG: response regulator, partial [bacterium]|nr:response regulator [bacterium]
MSKILLVEDDNNLREIYEARLQAEGYEIITAQDGEAALAIAIKERPDLIISDVMMPKISGFDMLDILRGTPETRETKVIMMTALSQAEDKARAAKLGADRYLVKSQVTLEDVAKVAKEVLEGVSSTPNPTPETLSSGPIAASAIPGIPDPAVAVPVVPIDDTSNTPSVVPLASLGLSSTGSDLVAVATAQAAQNPAEPATTAPTAALTVAAEEPVNPVANLAIPEPTTQATATPVEPVLTTLGVATPPSAEAKLKAENQAGAAAPPTSLPEPTEKLSPELPPLYENSSEPPTPPPQPKPLDLSSSSVAMAATAELSEDSTAGQSGSPFLVSKPVTVIQASPATPPAEVDEASKIADSIESFLSTKAEVNEQANPVSLPAEPATET